MMKVVPVFAVLAFSVVTPSEARLSDVICDDTARLVAQIGQRQEHRKIAQGLRGPDTLLEMWITPRTGDWTLVQTYANGTSCIVAMGEHWETLETLEDPA